MNNELPVSGEARVCYSVCEQATPSTSMGT
jgi:hypothetical protein